MRNRSRFAGALSSLLLALPLLALYLFVESRPEPDSVAPRFLSADRGSFDLEALGALPGAGVPERLTWEGFSDVVLLSVGQDILRLALLEGSRNPVDTAFQLHEDLIGPGEKGGREVRAQRQTTDGERASLTTEFTDGRMGHTLGLKGAVLQVLAAPGSDVGGYFNAVGIVPRAPVSGAGSWMAAHRMTTYLGALVLYGILAAVVHLAVAGRRLRVRPPRGIQPVPPSELMARILAINGLGLPFVAVREGQNRVLLRWKRQEAQETEDGKYAERALLTLDLALHPERGVVTAVEVSGGLSLGKDGRSASASGSVSRGFSTEPYDPATPRGLSFMDGRWVTAQHDYSFDVLEMRDPIIGAVTASGWTWQPKVFSH